MSFPKSGKIHRKERVENALENEIKELKPEKVYKILRVEDNSNIEHKDEK
jgi:hypothetical protein